jgi:glycosyltransferase involved in cell wall biosynthesis
VLSSTALTFYDPVVLEGGPYKMVIAAAAEGTLSEILRSSGLEVHVAGVDLSVFNAGNAAWFADLMRQYGVDLVHINARAGAPVISAAWQHGSRIIHHWRRLAANEEDRQLLEFSDVVIVPCESARLELSRTIEPSKIVTVPEGLTLSRLLPAAGPNARNFSRATRGLKAGDEIITMIGWIGPEKKPDLLIRALPLILSSRPNAIVLLVGDIYSAHRRYAATLWELANSLGVCGRIRHLPFTGNIGKIYGLSDVFVSCNEDEAFGRAIVEAAVAGLPVVVPARGVQTCLAQQGFAVQMFDVKSVASLGQAVLDALSHGAVRTPPDANCLREWDISLHAERIMGIYDSLLAGSAQAYL